jgi:hypothetical protein
MPQSENSDQWSWSRLMSEGSRGAGARVSRRSVVVALVRKARTSQISRAANVHRLAICHPSLATAFSRCFACSERPARLSKNSSCAFMHLHLCYKRDSVNVLDDIFESSAGAATKIGRGTINPSTWEPAKWSTVTIQWGLRRARDRSSSTSATSDLSLGFGQRLGIPRERSFRQCSGDDISD